MINMTHDAFIKFKHAYDVYGTHKVLDIYKNESIVKDDSPKCQIFTMWHPLRDEADIAEYGQDISKMFYCIIYDLQNVDYNDVVTLYGDDYEVVSIKRYNTHIRLDVKKKKA